MHTATPWHVNAISGARIVGDASVKADKYHINGANCTVARVYRPHDAAHLVHCVNAHAALVAALRSFMRCHFDGCNCAQCDEARAALAAATGDKHEV